MSQNSQNALPNEHHLAEIGRINARRGEGSGVRWIHTASEYGDALAPHPPGVIFDHSGLTLSGGAAPSFLLGAVRVSGAT